jgi:ABC-type Fe3+ transport system permease subunit
MLSFAMPGTVVGISYILAFNAPPIELAYTASSSSRASCFAT